MRLLLDTHVLLWALGEPARISKQVRSKIESPRNTVFASAVSIWEIELKRVLGKLRAPDDLDEQLRAARMEELSLRISHTKELAHLPPIHRDPFDRMLIAQAIAEELVFVTADAEISKYSVRMISAH